MRIRIRCHLQVEAVHRHRLAGLHRHCCWHCVLPFHALQVPQECLHVLCAGTLFRIFGSAGFP